MRVPGLSAVALPVHNISHACHNKQRPGRTYVGEIPVVVIPPVCRAIKKSEGNSDPIDNFHASPLFTLLARFFALGKNVRDRNYRRRKEALRSEFPSTESAKCPTHN